jgi:hypothetical protein
MYEMMKTLPLRSRSVRVIILVNIVFKINNVYGAKHNRNLSQGLWKMGPTLTSIWSVNFTFKNFAVIIRCIMRKISYYTLEIKIVFD